jgi:putative salt-induced outer membrane protein YdiY
MTLIALLAAGWAHAADSTFAGALAPGQLVGPAQRTGAAQFGGTWTGGNASSYLVTSSLAVAQRWDRTRLGSSLSLNVGRARADSNGDGHLDDRERRATPAETARRIGLEARYDRYVGDRDSLYALAGTLTDPFAGFDLRSHAQVGFSRTLRSTRAQQIVGEVGADVAREDLVDGVSPATNNVWALRTMLRASHRFNEAVTGQAQVELLENVVDLRDARLLGNAALVAKLTGTLDVRLSTQLTYDHAPVEGFVPFDQVTVATLVANFP